MVALREGLHHDPTDALAVSREGMNPAMAVGTRDNVSVIRCLSHRVTFEFGRSYNQNQKEISMKPDIDAFVPFDDLSPEDIRFLFGETATKESIADVFKKQSYQITRTDRFDHTVVLGESEKTSHPYAVTWLPDGWVASGGGAEADWSGPGSMLTMSTYTRSGSRHGWKAKAKDHIHAEAVVLYVWVVGLR